MEAAEQLTMVLHQSPEHFTGGAEWPLMNEMYQGVGVDSEMGGGGADEESRSTQAESNVPDMENPVNFAVLRHNGAL